MTGANVKLINLDELSEKISINLDSRKEAVNEALVFIDANAEAEYSRIKGLSNLKSRQKNIKEKLKSIKEQALVDAKDKLKSEKILRPCSKTLLMKLTQKTFFTFQRHLNKLCRKLPRVKHED